MTASAREVSQSAWAALEEGNLQAALALYDDDVLYVSNGRRMEGKDAVSSHFGSFMAAFSQIRGEFQWEICAGDAVVSEYVLSALHSGDFVSYHGLVAPATRRRLSFSGVTMQRIRDGLIVEEREVLDTATFLAQLQAGGN